MNREVCGICWCPYDDNGACGCKPQTGVSMNREDIIRMAREAASEDGSIDRKDGKNVVLYAAKTSRFLERFAALQSPLNEQAARVTREPNQTDAG
jgi:hypothetical protein